MRLLFVKFNRDRLPQFQISTAIYKEGNTKKVVKKPLTEEAVHHIQAMSESYKTLKRSYFNCSIVPSTMLGTEIQFPFIEGNSFDSLMFEAVFNRDQSLFLSHLERFYNFLRSLGVSAKRFPEHKDYLSDLNMEIKRPYECLDVSNVDLTFENVIINQAGDHTVIDYEWVFQQAVPIQYLLYRSLHLFFWKYRDYTTGFLKIEEIYPKYNINEEDIQLFNEMEEAFQAYVMGKTKAFSIAPQYRKNQKTLDELINEINHKNVQLEQLKKECEASQMVIEQLKKDKLAFEYDNNRLKLKLDANVSAKEQLKDELKKAEKTILQNDLVIKEFKHVIKEQVQKIEIMDRFSHNITKFNVLLKQVSNQHQTPFSKGKVVYLKYPGLKGHIEELKAKISSLMYELEVNRQKIEASNEEKQEILNELQNYQLLQEEYQNLRFDHEDLKKIHHQCHIDNQGLEEILKALTVEWEYLKKKHHQYIEQTKQELQSKTDEINRLESMHHAKSYELDALKKQLIDRER
ncbi:hypothetical protein [Paenibacillus beijingensis]|uniref:Uncharacterized protein n=1 Tax=Paenibacillus beijingensis TaxID=1126833 RepID=A0A0D5NHZ5_9BACL|nr:hypothetical protein [Paenibacillus beijingensis]AJY74602.1 hypothetical protein VN24_08465 [Paenibacillus beijingensis]